MALANIPFGIRLTGVVGNPGTMQSRRYIMETNIMERLNVLTTQLTDLRGHL
jgi:hypothetical protein